MIMDENKSRKRIKRKRKAKEQETNWIQKIN
jgi:hypothetical protein